MKLPSISLRTLTAGSVLVAPLLAYGASQLPQDEFQPRHYGHFAMTASTTLTTASGESIGTVRFISLGDKTLVRARLALPADQLLEGFHGFHVHANDDPANGVDCIADPAAPASTWFVSADGHLADVDQTHGAHKGDLPSVLVNSDGTADLVFTTDKVSPADLDNRVVVMHAGPDNFGNVPVGPDAEQYQPNSPAASTKTAKTGNAGDRMACGVVKLNQ
jgi:superoxide dismutase, Cu-Zn family